VKSRMANLTPHSFTRLTSSGCDGAATWWTAK